MNLDSALTPVAARYAVTVVPPPSAKTHEKPKTHTWYFYRDAQRIALLKGNVDEIWYRDGQQRISFERVFHEDERVVDYSTGELQTLRVIVHWAELSSFVHPDELRQLKLNSKHGAGDATLLHLSGVVGQERLAVDWLPALQLPKRITRQDKSGFKVRMELLESAEPAPHAWPRPGAKSADYLHLDAADFGDMSYDPVVRKSEALDVRLGWRAAHAHE
ncbi:hypothetical protein [Limnohabitans sp.]|uniref:hypothetical protein n=1 Tax=Limnohabitans sp. TaxID=1907725 RepID=UPI0038BC8621